MQEYKRAAMFVFVFVYGLRCLRQTKVNFLKVAATNFTTNTRFNSVFQIPTDPLQTLLRISSAWRLEKVGVGVRVTGPEGQERSEVKEVRGQRSDQSRQSRAIAGSSGFKLCTSL